MILITKDGTIWEIYTPEHELWSMLQRAHEDTLITLDARPIPAERYWMIPNNTESKKTAFRKDSIMVLR